MCLCAYVRLIHFTNFLDRVALRNDMSDQLCTPIARALREREAQAVVPSQMMSIWIFLALAPVVSSSPFPSITDRADFLVFFRTYDQSGSALAGAGTTRIAVTTSVGSPLESAQWWADRVWPAWVARIASLSLTSDVTTGRSEAATQTSTMVSFDAYTAHACLAISEAVMELQSARNTATDGQYSSEGTDIQDSAMGLHRDHEANVSTKTDARELSPCEESCDRPTVATHGAVPMATIDCDSHDSTTHRVACHLVLSQPTSSGHAAVCGALRLASSLATAHHDLDAACDIFKFALSWWEQSCYEPNSSTVDDSACSDNIESGFSRGGRESKRRRVSDSRSASPASSSASPPPQSLDAAANASVTRNVVSAVIAAVWTILCGVSPSERGAAVGGVETHARALADVVAKGIQQVSSVLG